MSGSLAGAVFALATISALADWVAVARNLRRVGYVCKPATLALLLLAGWLLTGGRHDDWAAPFFLFALAASLVGDICLMLPDERLFLPGLVAFLAAHLGYVAGLNRRLPPREALLLALPIAVISAVFVRSVVRGLRVHGQTKLLVPVVCYSLVISLMLFSAWSTLFRSDWSALRRLLVIGGASLFFASDAMLAWDRFVAPSPLAKLRVRVSYHLAQLALAASIALGV